MVACSWPEIVLPKVSPVGVILGVELSVLWPFRGISPTPAKITNPFTTL